MRSSEFKQKKGSVCMDYPTKMKVLIACEESQTVCKAFRERGHEAYSCDLLPSSGGKPEWHLKCNVFDVIYDNWDLRIGFPPCDHLAVSGARWFPEKKKDGRQQKGIDFFMRLAEICNAIENPIGIMSSLYRKPDQIIQPWMFGHGETKSTCLWLKGLPPLNPTKEVSGREGRVWKMPPSKDRARLRSKTFPGIAKAMAEQWG